MFTGLVEGLGMVRGLEPVGESLTLVLEVPDEMQAGAQLGESVALNGCCLTAVEFRGNLWTFQAGSETLSKTNLGRLRLGDPVNLERALPANGRLGGHFVQGHVDGVGEVDRVDTEGEWRTFWFRLPIGLARQIIPKGSVAVDGVSLTAVNVERERFSVALIPHTLAVTTLGRRQPGDVVNIETDVLGKYVQKFLRDPELQLPPSAT
jgi:riboflavin synthase